MKRKGQMIVVFALAASVSSPAFSAASGEDGFQACVSALVKDLSDAQGHPLQATIAADSMVADDRLGRRTRIYLDARDPVSRAVVAKADCIVNRQAEVMKLLRLPDDAPLAEERSL